MGSNWCFRDTHADRETYVTLYLVVVASVSRGHVVSAFSSVKISIAQKLCLLALYIPGPSSQLGDQNRYYDE
jgi:hypothetical protein